MARALYRTHRPQKLSDVVGQEHVTEALARALKKGIISHAYLFTGPRGTGKTSIARILAHEINNLPYEDDATHLDIIEIDAASNRRIDEIRDLRDKVHIAPTSAKYKVYIIDEVHMLTKEAFNALLKTLEEPPAHVVFMLATTEAHKLPDTIISRTQRFSLKPVELAKVTDHLRAIATAEDIAITDDALALIAAHGEGSFRDSISLLDQVRGSGEEVTLAAVQRLLGIAPDALIAELVAALAAKNVSAIAAVLQTMQASGHEPARVAKQLGQSLRAQLLASDSALPAGTAMSLLTKLIDVPTSHDPKTYLEIILIDSALASGEATASPKTVSAAVAKPPVTIEPHPSSLRKAPKADDKPEEQEEAPSPDPRPVPETPEPLDATVWPKVLAAVKAKHNTLFSIVRTVQPHFEAGKVTLECGYPFHQKRLNDKRNKQTIGDIIAELTGQQVQIACVLGEPADVTNHTLPDLPPDTAVVHTVQAEPVSSAPKNPVVETISNIFGGAELLES